jgi:sigma-B regulation protein RsbU (phosphoserine phosphatase)
MKELPSLRSVLNAFEEGVCLIDEVGHVLCVNAAAEELLGYTEEDPVGGPFLPNGDVALSNDVLISSAASVIGPSNLHSWSPVQLLRKDGRVMNVLCSKCARTETGSLLLKFRRLDPERARDVGLPDIKPKLKAIFDAVPDGMIVIDEFGDIQLFSLGAEKLFGYQQAETLDQNVKMLTPSPYREAHDRYLAAFRETGLKKIIGIGREVRGQRKDGSVFPMYLARFGWPIVASSLALPTT